MKLSLDIVIILVIVVVSLLKVYFLGFLAEVAILSQSDLLVIVQCMGHVRIMGLYLF